MSRWFSLLLLIVAGCGQSSSMDRNGMDGAVDGAVGAGRGDGDGSTVATDLGSGGSGDLKSGASGDGLLVDGPVGSRIPGWNPQDPAPVLLLAHRVQPAAWILAIADIGADGTISNLVNVDRVRAFGFSGANAPSQIYDGGVAGAQATGWSANAPQPLLILSRRSGQSVWVPSLATIDASGSLGGIVNVDHLRVWRFSGAPVVDGTLPGARIPMWNASAPGPLLLAAAPSGSSSWFVGSGSVADDGSIGDLAAGRVIAWTP